MAFGNVMRMIGGILIACTLRSSLYPGPSFIGWVGGCSTHGNKRNSTRWHAWLASACISVWRVVRKRFEKHFRTSGACKWILVYDHAVPTLECGVSKVGACLARSENHGPLVDFVICNSCTWTCECTLSATRMLSPNSFTNCQVTHIHVFGAMMFTFMLNLFVWIAGGLLPRLGSVWRRQGSKKCVCGWGLCQTCNLAKMRRTK